MASSNYHLCGGYAKTASWSLHPLSPTVLLKIFLVAISTPLAKVATLRLNVIILFDSMAQDFKNPGKLA